MKLLGPFHNVEYGDVPPFETMLTEPVEAPLQLTLYPPKNNEGENVLVIDTGSVSVLFKVKLQPFASVMITE